MYFTVFNLTYFYAPERFYNDEKHILSLIEGDFSIDGFVITAYFYKFLLIEYTGVYINLLIINIFINYLMINRIFKYNNFINLYIGLLYILPAIYFSHLSKEIPVFLLIFISVFKLRNYKYLKYLPLILIGLFIRNYWLIIIINLIIIGFFAKSILEKFIYLIISNSFFVIFYKILFNENISNIRDNLTNIRIDSINSDSIIFNLNFFNPGIFNDLINYYYSILIIVAPLIVVNQIKLQYIFLNIIQIFLIIKIFKFRLQKLSKVDSFCLNIFISTLMTIIVFEPDLGSFSRHEFILFPFLVYLLNKNSNK